VGAGAGVGAGTGVDGWTTRWSRSFGRGVAASARCRTVRCRAALPRTGWTTFRPWNDDAAIAAKAPESATAAAALARVSVLARASAASRARTDRTEESDRFAAMSPWKPEEMRTG